MAVNNNMNITLRDFEVEDLKIYEKWLTNINAKKYLSRFYPKHYNRENVQNLDFYLWYIIQIDDREVGVIWLEKNEKQDQTVKLGIVLGDKTIFNKKIGQTAIPLAINKAKAMMNISSVTLNVRSNNQRAIKCYKRCGFEIVSKRIKLNKQFRLIKFYKMTLNLNI
jgi:RimJ/RimL family protein N-acetyltransferase